MNLKINAIFNFWIRHWSQEFHTHQSKEEKLDKTKNQSSHPENQLQRHCSQQLSKMLIQCWDFYIQFAWNKAFFCLYVYHDSLFVCELSLEDVVLELTEFKFVRLKTPPPQKNI